MAAGLVAAAIALAAVVLAVKGGASGRRHEASANLNDAASPAAVPPRFIPSAGDGRAARAATTGSASGDFGESTESPEIRRLVALGKPIYCAAPHGDEVALTFDDGPGQYTRLALDKLKKHRIKATFFIVGRNIPLMPAAIRQERSLGAVGDHTFTHPLLTGLSAGDAEMEIGRTQRAVEAASGGDVFLFRPPYGARNARIDSIAKAHHLVEIMWTVDSADSLGASYAQIEHNVIGGLRPGAIILMHENHGQTIRAMLSIFAALQRKHLRTVSVARLLTDDPPTVAQVKAGGRGCGVSSRRGPSGG